MIRRLVLLLALASLPAGATAPASPLPAVELQGEPWLNVPKPLGLPDLRGRVVLLHFWDSRRLSDWPSLRTLQALQARHPQELSVIGIHSGAAAGLRGAVLSRDITHPVVHDADGRLSRGYGAEPPVIIAIDRQGMIAARYDSALAPDFPERVAGLLLEGKARPEEPPPLELALERDLAKAGPLAFPARALAVDARVFIADTNNHRIVIADTRGRVLDVIGSGLIGGLDGPFERAAFNYPRGLAWDGQALYIADTENHQIRRADLKTRTVAAWAGEPGLWPWDLLFMENRLFIASPIKRQVLAMDPRTRRLSVFAGCGLAGSEDGALAKASFMEPAGLAMENRGLPAPGVPGAGVPPPTGIGRGLLVADAAAGSLRRVDLETYEVTTLSSGSLKRPSGLAALGGPEKLKGLKRPPPGPPPPPMPEAGETNLPWARVRADAQAAISLDVRLPAGQHLNPRAPFYYRIAETRGLIKFDPATRKGFLANPKLPVRLSFRAPAGKCEALLGVYYYYCRKDNRGPCHAKSRLYRIPIEADPAESSTTVEVTATAD